MNYGGVCRTAPATPGLLIRVTIIRSKLYGLEIFRKGFWVLALIVINLVQLINENQSRCLVIEFVELCLKWFMEVLLPQLLTRSTTTKGRPDVREEGEVQPTYNIST